MPQRVRLSERTAVCTYLACSESLSRSSRSAKISCQLLPPSCKIHHDDTDDAEI